MSKTAARAALTPSYKIMIVGDDAALAQEIGVELTAIGYDAVTETPDKCLAHLQISRPHLVISDLRMHGMDGLTLFEEIHKVNPALPVIIVTAHGSIDDAVAATRRGVFAFLTRPLDMKELLDQVDKALNISGHLELAKLQQKDLGWRREIITRSPGMEDLLSHTWLVAKSDASVFIHGESGTGKELLARALHRASDRHDKPFVAVNCSAIPEPLLESELFGHSKGSFTGAIQNHTGLFQAAHTGTLFLDEIGDMPLTLQVKLLRVLQDKHIRPVGSTQTIPVDVRIVSATHRNLEQEMAVGNFREDLFYRLNVVTLEVPSLNDRREDIRLLANHFLGEIAQRYGKKIKGFSTEAMELLVNAAWPGNVRQLVNVIEQTVALCPTQMITPNLLPKTLRERSIVVDSFVDARKKFEYAYLTRVMRAAGGNVSQAAMIAQRNRTEFYKLLNRHALDPSLFKIPNRRRGERRISKAVRLARRNLRKRDRRAA